jgi:hypothetical protein
LEQAAVLVLVAVQDQAAVLDHDPPYALLSALSIVPFLSVACV